MLEQIGILRSRIIYDWKPLNRQRMMRFYSQFIGPGDLCFDLGAHTGNRTDVWNRLGACVVAVEPQPIFTRFLEKKFAGEPGITIMEAAIGAKCSSGLFNISPLTPTVSTLAGRSWQRSLNARATFKSKWLRQLQVKVITLDVLIENFGMPSFCKIDVEGYELQVLQGLSKPLPALSFEFFAWTPKISLQCVHLLEMLGSYEYNWSVRERHSWESENWLTPEELEKKLQKIAHASFSGDIYARFRT